MFNDNKRQPTFDLTDFDDDDETWSAVTGRDSGTGCNVGVLMVCC